MVLSSGAEGREIKNNPTSPHNLMPHLICLLLSSPHSTYKNIFLFHFFKTTPPTLLIDCTARLCSLSHSLTHSLTRAQNYLVLPGGFKETQEQSTGQNKKRAKKERRKKKELKYTQRPLLHISQLLLLLQLKGGFASSSSSSSSSLNLYRLVGAVVVALRCVWWWCNKSFCCYMFLLLQWIGSDGIEQPLEIEKKRRLGFLSFLLLYTTAPCCRCCCCSWRGVTAECCTVLFLFRRGFCSRRWVR